MAKGKKETTMAANKTDETVTQEQVDQLEAQIAALEAQRAEKIAAKEREERAKAMQAVDEKLVAARAVLKNGDQPQDVLAAINAARDAQIEYMRTTGHKVPARRSSGSSNGSTSARGSKVSDNEDDFARRVLAVLTGTPGMPFTNAELVEALTNDGHKVPSAGGAVPNAANSLLTKSLGVPGRVRQVQSGTGAVAYLYEATAEPTVLNGVTGDKAEATPSE